ncbi:MAG TPA: argininosuccinate lyase [Spirochaetia bacterium]|nr:argininosuccinate lyase [Spirochaetia bacterium]
MAKLWETREGGDYRLDPGVEAFLSSVSVDSRLLEEDLAGSLAHAAMLGEAGIISPAAAEALRGGLEALAAEAEAGSLAVDPGAEDVHSFVEAELTARLGDAGRSLHAGRSRNDQVALDLRLWLRSASVALRASLLDAIEAAAALAAGNLGTIMPGYTHLQRAQPVTFAYHLLAWCAALERDYGRLADAAARADECPLGACALAGTGLPIDRGATAAALGFARPSRNGMDAVADRDACVEFAAAAATILMHLSRYAEEICLWASAEFGFARLGSAASTGSSVMPQKRNPDPAELIRGKAGRAYGSLLNLLVLQKGLPLAYDRDLQEDKAAVFDAFDTALGSLRAFAATLRALEPRPARMREAAEDGCLWAADAAEFLVLRGLPFRTAYAAGRALVEAWEEARRADPGERGPRAAALLAGLGARGLAALHPAWAGVEPGALADYLALDACVARRKAPGGPAPERCAEELERLSAFVAGRRTAEGSRAGR